MSFLNLYFLFLSYPKIWKMSSLKITDASKQSAYPMELDNIVDNTYMFKLELKSSDSQSQDEVFKVVSFTDDNDIIEKYKPPSSKETFKVLLYIQTFIKFNFYYWTKFLNFLHIILECRFQGYPNQSRWLWIYGYFLIY